LRHFLGITALAWIHRIAFLLSNRDRSWPFTVFYEGDSETYYLFARAILQGRPYDGGIPFHPPGFPYFLAGVHALLGAGPSTETVPHLAVKIVMALVGSLPVGLIYLLVRPYAGRGVALLAAGLSLYHFGLYVTSAAPVNESLYVTLLLLSLLIWSQRLTHPLAPANVSRPPARSRVLAAGLCLGILLGLAALTRAEGALVACLVIAAGAAGAFFPLRRAGLAGRLLPWLLAAAGFAAALTPWTARNATHLARVNEMSGGHLAEPLPTFVPITAYGPLNFALANNGEADGMFSRRSLPSHKGMPVLNLTNPSHLELFIHGYRTGWEYIRAHPGDFAALILKKWGYVFESLKLGWTQWDLPGGLSGIRRPVDLFVPHSRVGMWILIPWMVLGSIVLVRAGGPPRRWAVIVLGLTCAALFTTALFFGYARAGIVLVPLWMSLVAAGLVWAWSRVVPFLPFRRRPPARKVVMGLALALLIAEGWGATRSRTYQATGTSERGEKHLNRDAIVYLEPKEGAGDPDPIR